MPNHYPQHDETGSVRVPKRLVDRVRQTIQDYPETQLLMDGEETPDDRIAEVLAHVLDKWNYTPPVMNAYLISFDRLMLDKNMRAARKCIVDGAAVEVLEQVIRKLARNDMPYTAGNTTTQANAVWRNLLPIVQDMRLTFKEDMTNIKRAWNRSQVWGAIHSDLMWPTYGTEQDYIVVYY